MDGGICILYVDDDLQFAEMVATFLKREADNITVETATSASEGLDRLATAEFDCIVSDYDMAGQNGIEFLETVRDDHPELPFILFTGKGSEEVASDAISAGVSDYLQKQPGIERYSLLANRITNLVAQSRAEAQLETTAEQQRHVADLGQEALAGLPLDDLFERAVTAVTDALGTDYAKVLDYRPPHDDLLLRAGVGWRDGLVGDATVGIGEDSQAGHTLRTEEPIVVEDLRSEARFRGPPLLVEHDVVSGISVIIGSLDDPWGVLGTHTTEQTAFTDDDVTFVQNVSNVLATAIERTEREGELRQRTRAMDEAPVGITISDPAQDDNPLIYANDHFQTVTGYDEQDVIGRNCRFLQGKETDETQVTAMREAIDNREPVTVELRNYRTDGTEFWNRVSIAPIVDDSGTLRNFVGFQEDITRRKERERDREATIDFLQTICDLVTNTTLDFEEKITRLLHVGPEKLGLPYGYLTRIEVSADGSGGGTQTVIEASGDHDLLQPGDSCPLQQSYCRKTITQRGVLEVQDALAAGWGSDPAYEKFQLGSYIGIPISVNGDLYGTVFFAAEAPRERPFTEADRTFVRLLSQFVGYELERERVTQELQQQNEQLDEFASVVSHDLRNPLEVARGRLELAREDSEHDQLERVADAHGRMSTLIDDLLTLARQGERVSEMEAVELGALAERCWQNVSTDEAALDTETTRAVLADRNRLQQLLENLIRNAVEHGGETVTVTVGDLEGGFYVADDGPGIPDAERESIFEAGYSTMPAGTGFGLSIVERVVDAHGWALSVTEGPDGGARFEITGVSFAEE